jgi:hypothetical protein
MSLWFQTTPDGRVNVVTNKTITFQYSTSSNEAHRHKYEYEIRYVFDALITDMSIIENI